jgi:hypothetical protein
MGRAAQTEARHGPQLSAVITQARSIREQSLVLPLIFMDKTIRVCASRKEMKADEYRYWQSRPAHERMSAVAELTRAAYALKDPTLDVRRLQRTLVCLQRPPR